MLAFLSDADGVHVSWSIPPGYDWYPPEKWQRDDIQYGRFSLALPEGLPEGTYDLGWVVLGTDGTVLGPAREHRDEEADVPDEGVEEPPLLELPAGAVAGGVGDSPARFAVGEVRFDGRRGRW